MKSSTAIILLLLSAGLSYTFTNNQYQDVKELQVLADKYSSTLQDVESIVSLRDQLIVTYQSISPSEIDRINKALPNNMDTVRLALDLDGIASRYGVTIKSIQASTASSGGGDPNLIVLPENAKAYDKASVSFSFVSNYQNFANLIMDLEKNLRIMDIKSVKFTVADTGLYDHSISVDTYWLK